MRSASPLGSKSAGRVVGGVAVRRRRGAGRAAGPPRRALGAGRRLSRGSRQRRQRRQRTRGGRQVGGAQRQLPQAHELRVVGHLLLHLPQPRPDLLHSLGGGRGGAGRSCAQRRTRQACAVSLGAASRGGTQGGARRVKGRLPGGAHRRRPPGPPRRRRRRPRAPPRAAQPGARPAPAAARRRRPAWPGWRPPRHCSC